MPIWRSCILRPSPLDPRRPAPINNYPAAQSARVSRAPLISRGEYLAVQISRQNHSSRNAITGSTRMARRAGIHAAGKVIPPRKIGTAAKVTASCGLRPYRMPTEFGTRLRKERFRQGRLQEQDAWPVESTMRARQRFWPQRGSHSDLPRPSRLPQLRTTRITPLKNGLCFRSLFQSNQNARKREIAKSPIECKVACFSRYRFGDSPPPGNSTNLRECTALTNGRDHKTANEDSRMCYLRGWFYTRGWSDNSRGFLQTR